MARHKNPFELTLFHFTYSCGSFGLFTAKGGFKFGQSLGPILLMLIVVRTVWDMMIVGTLEDIKLHRTKHNRMKTYLIAASFIALPGLVFAHGGAKGPTKVRMDAMVSTKDSLSQLRAATNGAEIDRTAALQSLEELRTFAAALPELFEEKHLPEMSEALPGIWEDPEQFDAEIRFFNQQVDLAQSQLADDPDRVLRTVAAGCASCHDKFREKKQ